MFRSTIVFQLGQYFSPYNCVPVFAVPFVNNEALSSKLRNAQEELVTNVKCTQVPRVHVQGLNHVFLHELCHVYVFWEEKNSKSENLTTDWISLR